MWQEYVLSAADRPWGPTSLPSGLTTCVIPGKAKERDPVADGTQWQMNMRSINHFPSPVHSDQAHSKHGGMLLVAWPMFSRALELTGSKLHGSPLRRGIGCEIAGVKLPSSHLGTCSHDSLRVKLAPGKEATSGFSVLVPGLYSLSLRHN